MRLLFLLMTVPFGAVVWLWAKEAFKEEKQGNQDVAIACGALAFIGLLCVGAVLHMVLFDPPPF